MNGRIGAQMLSVVLGQVLEQLCSRANSTETHASSSNYHLPEIEIDANRASSTTLCDRETLASQMSQGWSSCSSDVAPSTPVLIASLSFPWFFSFSISTPLFTSQLPPSIPLVDNCVSFFAELKKNHDSNLDSTLKHSILYEHLLKDISPAPKNTHSPAIANDSATRRYTNYDDWECQLTHFFFFFQVH